MILAAFRRPDFFAEGRQRTEGGGWIIARVSVLRPCFSCLSRLCTAKFTRLRHGAAFFAGTPGTAHLRGGEISLSVFQGSWSIPRWRPSATAIRYGWPLTQTRLRPGSGIIFHMTKCPVCQAVMRLRVVCCRLRMTARRPAFTQTASGSWHLPVRCHWSRDSSSMPAFTVATFGADCPLTNSASSWSVAARHSSKFKHSTHEQPGCRFPVVPSEVIHRFCRYLA